MSSLRLAALVALASSFAAFAACGDDAADGPATASDASAGGDTAATGGPDGSTPGADGSVDGAPAGDGATLVDAGPPRIYVHSPLELYVFNPVAQTLARVGAFSPAEIVTDLAVDEDGHLVAATLTGLRLVDPATAAMTPIGAGDAGPYFNNLAFAPKGAFAGGAAVVGFTLSDAGYAERYLRVDTTTGAATPLGDLNPPGSANRYTIAGDLSWSSVTGKAYVAVQAVDAAPGAADLIAEVSPTTGQMGAVLGSTTKAQVFGLASWEGTLYAFTNDGTVVAFEPGDGGARVVAPTRTFDAGPDAALPFWGAASSPLAR